MLPTKQSPCYLEIASGKEQERPRNGMLFCQRNKILMKARVVC